VYTRKEWNL